MRRKGRPEFSVTTVAYTSNPKFVIIIFPRILDEE